MNKNSFELKDLLMRIINKQKQDLTGLVSNPHVDFSRNRKIPYENMILSLLTMEGTTLTNELLRQFGCSTTTATASAFVQQRKKILPFALESLFRDFSSQTSQEDNYKGYKLLAVDGSDIQIPTNLNDEDSLFITKEGVKPYNLLHLNALYNLLTHTYEDAIVFKRKETFENKALVEMVDRSIIKGKAIVIMDRGYEAYNNMAHIQEKGWFYLIRVKDFNQHKTGILHGLELPNTDEFDEYINLNLTRKQTNEMKKLFQKKNSFRRIAHNKIFDYLPSKSRKSDEAVLYHLPFRIVRFPISDDSYEVVVTNLDASEFPPATLKMLYGMRWGIETSFRDLKYTVGLLHFHSKKIDLVYQEIYAHLLMYNFVSLMITGQDVQRKNRRHSYKSSFSMAIHASRLFFQKKISQETVIMILSKYLTPIRPDRKAIRRKKKDRSVMSFNYRLA